MVKLFAIISRADLAAMEGRGTKLSLILPNKWEEGDGVQELKAVPQVPSDSETVTIEVAFAAETDLSPYVYQAMDAPLRYKLPVAVLDTGVVRAFSVQEMLVVAGETIILNRPPSPEPLWHSIMETPANERESRFGPYLTKAYDELHPKEDF